MVEEGDNSVLDDDIEDEAFGLSDYSNKSEYSKAKKVYDAVGACRIARSKEMRPGYENITFPKDGMPIKSFIDDARKVYISSVIALSLVLSPECNRDKTYKDGNEKLTKEEKELWDKFAYNEKEIVIERDPMDKVKKPMIKPTGRKFMPLLNTKVIINDKGFGVERIGGWDNNVNAYYDILVDIYDKRFALLNDLIDKLNYFRQSLSF